ncbi:MAG: hypothetical protein DI537_53800 [Stutzerimonas stutzeri]|nr:MAG: hypothetical protein DI537_53800 [Stutzerimonas stutzeri]
MNTIYRLVFNRALRVWRSASQAQISNGRGITTSVSCCRRSAGASSSPAPNLPL